MDKSKSKDNLRAAGKKRLEEFRQKKQHKGSSGNKAAPEMQADDNKPLVKFPLDADRPSTKHSNDVQGSNSSGIPETGTEATAQIESGKDDSVGPAAGNLPNTANAIADSVSSDNDHSSEDGKSKDNIPEFTNDSNVSAVNGFQEFSAVPPGEQFTEGNKPDEPSSNGSHTQSLQEDAAGLVPSSTQNVASSWEASEEFSSTEVDALRRQLQVIMEEKNLLEIKSQQHLEEIRSSESLVTEIEVLRKELISAEEKKALLSDEYGSSQKELKVTNDQLVKDLTVSQGEVDEAKHEASRLAEDLGLIRSEMDDINANFREEMESMQQRLADEEGRTSQLMSEQAATRKLLHGSQEELESTQQKLGDEEGRTVQLMTELAATSKRLYGLQEEKASLIDELGRYGHELHSLGDEKQHLISELEASKRSLQTVEEDLLSERQSLQQMQELVDMKSQSVEASRIETERLQAWGLAVQADLESSRNQLQDMEAQNLELTGEVEQFQGRLEARLHNDLEAQDAVFQELLKKKEDEKAELLAELEKSKQLGDKLREERVGLETEQDAALQQLREDLERMRRDRVDQGNEHARLSDEQSEVVRKTEIALQECRTEVECMIAEKSQATMELKSAKEDLQRLTDEMAQVRAVKMAVESEVVAHLEQITRLEERDSSLTRLLEDSKSEVQRLSEDNLQYSAEHAWELEKSKTVSSGLSEENGRMALELKDATAHGELLQQEVAQSERELMLRTEAFEKRAKEDEASRIQLVNHLTALQDEMSKLKDEKSQIEAEMARCEKRLAALEDVNKELAGDLDDHRERMEAMSEEKARLLSGHGTELERCREQQFVLEQANAKLQADFHQSSADLQELKSGKDEVALELRTCKQQNQTMEDENQKLASELLTRTGQLQHDLDEAAVRASTLESELNESRKQVKDLEEAAAVQVIDQEDYRERLQHVNEQNMKDTERLQQRIEELVQFQEHRTIEVAEAQQRVQESEAAQQELLLRVEDLAQQLKNLSEDRSALLTNVKGTEGLQQRIEELVQLQEHRTLEVAEAQQRAQDSEAAQQELLLRVEDLAQQLKDFSEDRSALLSNLEVSQRELDALREEKEHTSLEFESARDNWRTEKLQLSRDLEVSLENQRVLSAEKAQADFELEGLKPLKEISKVLEQERDEARAAESAVGLELKMQAEHLKGIVEENVQFTSLIESLKNEQMQAGETFLQLEELQSRVKELAEVAVNLEIERDTALKAESATQAEVDLFKSKLEESRFFADRSQELETTVATLEKERQEISEKSAALEQSHVDLSETALHHSEANVSLQNQLDAFKAKIADNDAQLGDHKAMALQSQRHVESLIQKLEDAMGDAFSKDGEEHVPAQDDKASLAYCSSLTDRLHDEFAAMRDQLRSANSQLSTSSDLLREAKDELPSLRKERESLMETNEQIHSKLQGLIKEKEALEASLLELRTFADGEKEAAVGQINELTDRYDAQLAQKAMDMDSLHADVSTLQKRLAEQESTIAVETEVSSKLKDELKSIVSNLRSANLVVDPEESSKDLVLPDSSLSSQLDRGFTELLKRSQESALEVEELKKIVLHSSDSEQDLANLAEENSKLRQLLQRMQETLESQNLELDALNDRVEEEETVVTRQASEIDGLSRQLKNLSGELEKELSEKASLQAALTQAEQKVSVTREKLSLAVNKGKAVVQQRDSWKASLAEKSKELDLLVARHQQDLEAKDAALTAAEAKVMEQTVFFESELGTLRKSYSTAEQVFQENRVVIQGLAQALDGRATPADWDSLELVSKIVWIVEYCKVSTEELMRKGEEVQILTERASMLTGSFQDSEAKVGALAAELRSLEQEKEELVSRVEFNKDHLEQELQRLTEEKGQLQGIIRQLDSDTSEHNRNKADLSKRLQEQDVEIAALLKTVGEQKEEITSAGISYGTLDAMARILRAGLIRLCEGLALVDLDMNLTVPPWQFCKEFLMKLIGFHSVTVVNVMKILHEICSQDETSDYSVQNDTYQSLEGKFVFSEISDELIGDVEDAFTKIERQAISLEELSQEMDRRANELAGEQKEKSGLQLKLTQLEQRLAVVEEEHSAAVANGISLGQKHDSVRQVLLEKTAELESLASGHGEELEFKERALQEANDSLASSFEHVGNLEKELISLRESLESRAEPSVGDELNDLREHLSEAELRAGRLEAEAESARNAAARLSAEQDISQLRLSDLDKELESMTRAHGLLLQQLEASKSDHKTELESVISEKAQLVSEISRLEQDLAMERSQREKSVQEHEELLHNFGELKSRSLEDVSSRDTLHGDVDALHQRVAELEVSLQSEASSRVTLASSVEAAVAKIRQRFEEPMVEESGASVMSESDSPQISGNLEALSTLLLLRYDAARQEAQELSDQKALLAESQRTMAEERLSEREMLEHVKKELASKDSELLTLTGRLEAASSHKDHQENAVQESRKEVHILKEQLVIAKSERDALSSQLEDVEQKAAGTKEKLSLAVKKGKGLAVQRDSMKQSLSEQVLAIATCKEEIRNYQSALEKAMNERSVLEKQVRTLDIQAGSLRNLVSTLEQNLRDKDNLTKQMEALLTKCDFPPQQKASQFADKLEWLVSNVAAAQNSVAVANQEVESWKRTSMDLSAQLAESQTRAEAEQEARSTLGLRLEEREREIQALQDRVAEMEARPLETPADDEEVEVMTRKILQLEGVVQQQRAELKSAEEAVMAWAERSKESEKYIQSSQDRISELERNAREVSNKGQQDDKLLERISSLEEAVQQKEAAVKAMEISRGKAVQKLTTTVNKFQDLCRQSEGLVVELERMHGNLQEKEAEITELKEEILKINGRSRRDEALLASKKSFLEQLGKYLETATALSANDSESPPFMMQKDLVQLDERHPDEESCLASISVLQSRLSDASVKSQAWQADVEKRDLQLQRLRKELEEVATERARLKTSLQREQLQTERLKAEVTSMHNSLSEKEAAQVEELEEVQVGKRLLPMNVPSPHVRGARKPPAAADIAIDLEAGTSHSPSEFDEKGHGFQSLAGSRLMPRGTHAISEQIDNLCVAGGRLLMRRPAARLGLTLYWLAIHIWMVFLISAAHV